MAGNTMAAWYTSSNRSSRPMLKTRWARCPSGTPCQARYPILTSRSSTLGWGFTKPPGGVLRRESREKERETTERRHTLRRIMKNLKTQLRLTSLLSLILLACTAAYGQLTPSADAYTNTASPATNYPDTSTQTPPVEQVCWPDAYFSPEPCHQPAKLQAEDVTERSTAHGSINTEFNAQQGCCSTRISRRRRSPGEAFEMAAAR
jgi:hypothetical protein